jgi:predicted protein tyrosine phosphatase
MILPPLSRHLAVCSLSEVQRFLDMDKNFWHVISIRDTTRLRLQLMQAKKVRPFYFDDAEVVEEGSKWIVISAAQAAEIWQAMDADPAAPLLVHCVAGLSRSTAVAASIIARALHDAGLPLKSIAPETVERLLTIRPPACPNGMGLLRMLEQVLPAEAARQIAQEIWEDDRILHNRFVRAH